MIFLKSKARWTENALVVKSNLLPGNIIHRYYGSLHGIEGYKVTFQSGVVIRSHYRIKLDFSFLLRCFFFFSSSRILQFSWAPRLYYLYLKTLVYKISYILLCRLVTHLYHCYLMYSIFNITVLAII